LSLQKFMHTSRAARSSIPRLQFYRAKRGSRVCIQQQQRLTAIRALKSQHQARAYAADLDDLGPHREAHRRRAEGVRWSPGRERSVAAAGRDRPMRNCRNYDRGPRDQHHSHYDDEGLESAHGLGFTLLPMIRPVEAERRLNATFEPSESGERLDRALTRHFGDLSRTRIKHLVEEGRVSVEGATITDPSWRVKPGQHCTLAVPPPAAAEPEAQKIPLDIRYEDEHVIVLMKPAGLVVHPAPGNPDHTLVNALLAHCGGRLAGIGGVKRPGIVHRLDKDTSGLMVVAKTDLAHERLAADFAARRIERTYVALVWGVPAQRSGEIDAPIGRNPANRKAMAVVARGGKRAVTRYRVLRTFGTVASLLECRLATGRTHQIRVHLASIGHPLIGDPVYGRGRRRRAPAAVRVALDSFPRQALHAAQLGIVHPATGDQRLFTDDLPLDINSLINVLEML
jgi:23S rRNA pseudouridine1911/1915/1917 synthase